MHEFQPLSTVQGLGLHTQPMKIVEQIILNMVEPGFHLTHTLALNAKGDELGLCQTIVALGKLLAQHLRVFGTNIIETIFLERNTDAFLKLGAIRCHVHKRQFKLDGAVEKIEERTPFLENRVFVLLLSKLVIDVLVGNRPGVVVRLHPAGSILEHPLHGDGLLRCPGNSGLRRLFLAALTGLFPKRHGLTLLS